MTSQSKEMISDLAIVNTVNLACLATVQLTNLELALRCAVLGSILIFNLVKIGRIYRRRP